MNAVVDVHPSVDAITRWSALDRALARWVLVHGGDVTLAQAAGWASHADSQGNSALMLDPERARQLGIAQPEALHAALVALAADPGNGWLVRAEAAASNRDAPFVLDGHAFYLRRNFLDEVAVGQALKARLDTQPASSVALPEGALRELFPDQDNAEESPQRIAVRAALGQRLFVLTGGPGTGKTSTVLRLLMAQVRARGEGQQAAPIVCLAAPTGKAAQRLSESLREGAQRVSDLLPAHWAPALSHVLEAKPGTVHRLLAVRGDGRPGFHRGCRLPADVVVVDEASMLDMALLRALLDAMRDDALLVLVGDADQLAPVGIGTAFADLVGGLDGHPNLVRLQHSFRASRELVAINEAVRVGDSERFTTAWEAAGSSAIRHRLAHRRALSAHLLHWSDALADGLQHAGVFAVQTQAESAALATLFAVVRQRQLLCALREGQFGAIEANRQIERRLHADPALAAWADAQWYPGRLVIITRNDYSAGLFNGDIGLCLQLADADGNARLQVLFEAAPDGSGDAAPRRFDPVQLPPHETAFALTIHKSQGSEYDHVAVLLPPLAEHPLLLRQTLYTALSRARRSVELWAEPAAVNACITTPLGRAGRLAERLDPSA